jgi:integrase/recombinase XerC
VVYLQGRAEQTSAETIRKYRNSLVSFCRSLEAAGEPVVLGSMTVAAVNRWVADQRKRGLAEEGIASRLGSLKVFSRKYVFKQLDLTTVDLLERVPRLTPPDKPPPALTDEEWRRVRDCLDRDTFVDRRDTAMLAVYRTTGLRFKEVLEMTRSGLDRVTGEFTVVAKGGKVRSVKMSADALKLVRRNMATWPSDRRPRPTGCG